MSDQELQQTCIANQIDPIGALGLLSIVACLLPRESHPVSQADGFAEAYANGCPIIPESND